MQQESADHPYHRFWVYWPDITCIEETRLDPQGGVYLAGTLHFGKHVYQWKAELETQEDQEQRTRIELFEGKSGRLVGYSHRTRAGFHEHASCGSLSTMARWAWGAFVWFPATSFLRLVLPAISTGEQATLAFWSQWLDAHVSTEERDRLTHMQARFDPREKAVCVYEDAERLLLQYRCADTCQNQLPECQGCDTSARLFARCPLTVLSQSLDQIDLVAPLVSIAAFQEGLPWSTWTYSFSSNSCPGPNPSLLPDLDLETTAEYE